MSSDDNPPELEDMPMTDLHDIKLVIMEMQKKERVSAEKLSRLEVEGREKISRLEREVVEGREKISRLERELVDERKERNRLQEENKELREEIKELREELKEERRKRILIEGDLDILKQSTNDIATWIVAGCVPKYGGEPLWRIQIRNLLDRVQAKLAGLIGLTPDLSSRIGSNLWREKLDRSAPSSKLADRLASARILLQDAFKDPRNIPNRPSLTVFMSSLEAMHLAVEAKSTFRMQGDEIAHHNLNKHDFFSIIDKHCEMGGKHGDGLKISVQFLFP